MQGKQRAIVFTEYNKAPVFVKQFDIPQPKGGQVQIKVIGTTVNPSDRIRAMGLQGYFKADLPFIGGVQGFGEIIKAGDQQNKDRVGQKVSFFASGGCWCEYALAESINAWEVTEDVPVHCAASGLVNPLCVLGFIDTFRKWNKSNQNPSGIIHTAAASSVGRMLNRLCQEEKIPLLNIVRRKEQVELLQKEGAQNIINTSDADWLDQYKKAIKEQGFNVLFDALGGGDVTNSLIANLSGKSQAVVYGKLSPDSIKIDNVFCLMGGVSVTGFIIFEWMPTLTMKEVGQLQKSLSGHLKGSLSTTLAKKVSFQEFPSQWEESEKKATQGKYLITP